MFNPVTEEDLRAMARYRWEKGDDFEIRHYLRSRWREFAERPEVSVIINVACRIPAILFGVYSC